MQVQRGIEITMLADRREALVRTDMPGQLAAEEITKRAAGQPRKEIARDNAKPLRGSELGERQLNVSCRRPEEARKVSACQGCQSFGTGKLRHLPKVGAFASIANMAIDRARERGDNLQKSWLARYVEAKFPQSVGGSSSPCSLRDLGKEQKRMCQAFVLRCPFEAIFSGIGARSGDPLNIGAPAIRL